MANRKDWLKRIVIDPGIRRGAPCIRGTRVPVSVLVASIADGCSVAEVVQAYPPITEEDVRAALHYAAEAVSGVDVYPLAG